MSDNLIRPRTDSERHAYEAGYAAAIIDVDKHGLAKAREWALLMFDCEQHLTPDAAFATPPIPKGKK